MVSRNLEVLIFIEKNDEVRTSKRKKTKEEGKKHILHTNNIFQLTNRVITLTMNSIYEFRKA